MIDAPELMVEAENLAQEAFAQLRLKASQTPLSLGEIFSIGAAVRALKRHGIPTERVAVLGSLTTEYLSQAVACAMLREGVRAEIYEAPFGTYTQEILSADSGLQRFSPELCVLAPDVREFLVEVPLDADADLVTGALDRHVHLFESLWDRVADLGYRIVQHTLVPPPAKFRGAADRLSWASPGNQVRLLNDRLMQAGRGRVQWLEIDRLAAEVGLRNWHNPRLYFSAKLGFDLKWLNEYMEWFQGAWRGVSGRGKKALVLDLDNTLWGGVIGDDGVEGIRLGPSHGAVGEAYSAWQHYVKELGARGVILSVSSKNEKAIAVQAFSHPQSVLKPEDFAAFECSWNDKVHALRCIAAQLNVGLDALVFADDNPAEIALIRQYLPEVASVYLGSDPSTFVSTLDAGHWFDLPEYTAADLGRRGAYVARRAASDASRSATNLEDYLSGLEMTGEFRLATESDVPRLAQLETKTNQFNLTTRRYQEPAIRDYLSRDDSLVTVFSLRDRFGDHGIVSSLIGIVDERESLLIDDWLMSCRIFGRTAEQFILLRISKLATDRGLKRLIGMYRPTKKNGIVADLYPRLGFEKHDGDSWVLNLPPPSGVVTHILPETF